MERLWGCLVGNEHAPWLLIHLGEQERLIWIILVDAAKSQDLILLVLQVAHLDRQTGPA